MSHPPMWKSEDNSMELVLSVHPYVAFVSGTWNTRPEQRLHRLRQLRAARIARVHGDEDAHPRVKGDLLPFELGGRRESRE